MFFPLFPFQFVVEVFALRFLKALRAVMESKVAVMKSPPMFAATVANLVPMKVGLMAVFAGVGSVAKILPVGSFCRHGVHPVSNLLLWYFPQPLA